MLQGSLRHTACSPGRSIVSTPRMLESFVIGVESLMERSNRSHQAMKCTNQYKTLSTTEPSAAWAPVRPEMSPAYKNTTPKVAMNRKVKWHHIPLHTAPC